MHHSRVGVYTLFSPRKLHSQARIQSLIASFDREIVGNDGAQHGSELGGVLGTEAVVKTRLRPRVARFMTMSLARTLIVIAPSRFSLAKIENCVTCSPTGVRNWS